MSMNDAANPLKDRLLANMDLSEEGGAHVLFLLFVYCMTLCQKGHHRSSMIGMCHSITSHSDRPQYTQR